MTFVVSLFYHALFSKLYQLARIWQLDSKQNASALESAPVESRTGALIALAVWLPHISSPAIKVELLKVELLKYT